jgi:uncharacterized membrane protein YpjA
MKTSTTAMLFFSVGVVSCMKKSGNPLMIDKAATTVIALTLNAINICMVTISFWDKDRVFIKTDFKK